jgi:hypothetical protein
VVPLATVAPERVRWLWPGRVPLGKLTLLDGDPGLGKSAVMLDLAARVSRGAAMPDESRSDLDGPAGVVLVSTEDGLGDTIRPRLEAAGADLSRVVAVTGVPGEGTMRLVTLPRDAPRVARAAKELEARLVVIDPLMAYLDPAVNAYRDQDVRRALAPVSLIAEALDAAIVVVRHLNKATEGNPLYRGGGSIGIMGAARSGLVVGPDPDDPTEQRRVLAVVKGNLAAPAPALAYTLETVAVEAKDVDATAVRVAWQGTVRHTAATLLGAASEGSEAAGRDARGEAMAFLVTALADGPQPVAPLMEAARKAGLAEKTVRRAKVALGVVARKEGGGGWWWLLPPKVATPPQGGEPGG